MAQRTMMAHQRHVVGTLTQCARRMSDRASSVFWSAEWEKLNLGAKKAPAGAVLNKLLFVECGFGVDQHGKAEATKAAVRACRNAVEFNSIPGVIDVVPGGRANMLIRVKLGVPSLDPANPLVPLTVDLNEGFAPLHGVQHPTSEPLHDVCCSGQNLPVWTTSTDRGGTRWPHLRKRPCCARARRRARRRGCCCRRHLDWVA